MQFHPKDLSELDELTEEHLGFSALSEGLGFTKSSKKAQSKTIESFENEAGAPELARKAFSGTGAVAAGPARPVQSSMARQAPSPNVIAEPAAGQLVRVIAFFIDFLIIFMPLAFGWWLSFRSQSLVILKDDLRTPLFLFAFIFGAYFLLSESFGGQSLGKMLLGLRVVEDDKYQKPTGLSHAAARLAILAFGTAFLGLGLIASFRDTKRRPWHDRFSGSIVRKKA